VKDAYNRAVAEVLARTDYGTRVETPAVSCWRAGWSNGSRKWFVDFYKAKRGVPITLDANEILIYVKTKGEAKQIASHLPALPLDAGSEEAKTRGPEDFLSNPKGPEEQWLEGEESEGEHPFGDPTHSPYEGDIPPWGQQGYSGEFPMEGRVFYVNAYAVVEAGGMFNDNLERYGAHHKVGTFKRGLETRADFDYQPFASIPVRNGDKKLKDFWFRYLESIAQRIPLSFIQIVVEPKFPVGRQSESSEGVYGEVKFKDGRWFEYRMDTPFTHPKVEYISAYVENRLYGGPEEGGWWYDAGFPVAGIPYLKEWAATGDRMRKYLQDSIGYHTKYPLGSVLGHDVLSITGDDHFPTEYPQETPHYE
jgi:hypothetical protein